MSLILTHHAREKIKDHIPLSVARNIIKKRKGLIFYDRENDSNLLKYNKNVFVIENYPKDLMVINFYRDDSPYRYKHNEKYIGADKFQ